MMQSGRARVGSSRAVAAAVLLVALACLSPPSAGADGRQVAAATTPRPAGVTLRQAPPAGSPIGHVDSASAQLSFLGGSGFSLVGWAADPDLPGGRLEIHIYADGQYYQQTGGEPVLTGEFRSDVPAVFPWAGSSTGFTAGVFRPGEPGFEAFDLGRQEGHVPRTFCAYAINVGPGANTTLGCVVVPHDFTDGHEPTGAVDSVRLSPGMLSISGWAGDVDGTVGAPVRLRLNGSDSILVEPRQPRPDVSAAFPALGGNTGFSQDIPFPPGLHHICVDVGNVGNHGLHNRYLGCAFVMIPDASPPGSNDPIGTIDTVTWLYDRSLYSRYEVSGWVADPDSPDAMQVRLAALAAPLVFDITIPTEDPRPDVPTVFPWTGPNTGFRRQTLAGRAGVYCAYAIQPGGDASSQRFLGCAKAVR